MHHDSSEPPIAQQHAHGGISVADLFSFPSAAQIDRVAGLFPGADSAVANRTYRVESAELTPWKYVDGEKFISTKRTDRWLFGQRFEFFGEIAPGAIGTDYRGFREGVFSQLLISPGAVKLRRRDDAKVDDTQRRRALRRELAKGGIVDFPRPLTEVQAQLLDGYRDDEIDELARRTLRPLTMAAAIWLGEFEPVGFNKIQCWSRKSQNNLKLTISQLDLAPMLDAGAPVMITYTLPGDWLAVAPDAATAAATWHRFATLWRDFFGRPPASIWKREFQRRGAPHWHEWTVLPEPFAGFFPQPENGPSWAEFLNESISAMWTQSIPFACAGRCKSARPLVYAPTEIQCHSCAERARSLVAGTNVSYSKGASARDPRRLATYFLKESGDSEGKSYQNHAPREWGGGSIGRFWGVRGIKKAVATVDIEPCDSDNLWRVIRKLREAQRRRDSRRIKVRGRAGFALVNDGARVAEQLAKHLVNLRSAPGAALWELTVEQRRSQLGTGIVAELPQNYSTWSPPARIRAQRRVESVDVLARLDASYTPPDWEKRKARNERRWARRRAELAAQVAL